MREASIFREFLRYVSLNVCGMIGLSGYILADTFFVSKGLGADGLAALNLAIPVYSFVHGSGLMLGMGGATKYSVLMGQKEHCQADQLFSNVVYFTGILAAAFLLVGGSATACGAYHFSGCSLADYGSRFRYCDDCV